MKTPKLPRGVTVHNGSLRIAFSHPDYPNQIKRSLRIPPTAKNIKAAEMKLAVIRHEILLGTFVFDKHFKNDPLSDNQPVWLHDVIQKYVIEDAISQKLKAGSIRTYLSAKQTLQRETPPIDLRRFTVSDAAALYQTLEKQTSSKRAKDIIKVCNRACARAAQHSAIDANPFALHQPLRRTSQPLYETDVYTQTESDTLIATTRRLYGELAACYLTFQFWSGCRPGETRALTRQDYNNGMLQIDKTAIIAPTRVCGLLTNPPKTAAGTRNIVLPSRARAAFEKAATLHDRNEVFPSVHREVTKSITSISRTAWVIIVRESKLRYLPQYRTRHSFISWMVSAGEPLVKIAHHVGHRGTGMIERVYARFLPNKDMKWSFDDPEK